MLLPPKGLFRAEGPAIRPAKGEALDNRVAIKSLLSAQRANRSSSIPDVALVNLNLMLLTNQAEFLLKGQLSMMLTLAVNVLLYLVN